VTLWPLKFSVLLEIDRDFQLLNITQLAETRKRSLGLLAATLGDRVALARLRARFFLKFRRLASDDNKVGCHDSYSKRLGVRPDLGARLMDTVIRFVEALGVWGWIAVIVIGCVAIEGIVKVKRMQVKHAERMAKIQQGIDPGDESETYKKDEV
jgi:hypothetical protein